MRQKRTAYHFRGTSGERQRIEIRAKECTHTRPPTETRAIDRTSSFPGLPAFCARARTRVSRETAAAKYQSAYTLSPLAFQKGVRALGSAATSFCRAIPPLLTADPPQILRTPFCITPKQNGVRTPGQPCGQFYRVILRISAAESPHDLRTPFCGAVLPDPAQHRRHDGAPHQRSGAGHMSQTRAGPAPTAQLSTGTLIFADPTAVYRQNFMRVLLRVHCYFSPKSQRPLIRFSPGQRPFLVGRAGLEPATDGL